MVSAYLKFQTPKHLATMHGEMGSRRVELVVYSGGGFRWTKRDIVIQFGSVLFKQTVNLGTKWTYQLNLAEDFEEAIKFVTVKFADYDFTKAEFYIGPGPPEIQNRLKANIEMNRHLKVTSEINTGECCLIL